MAQVSADARERARRVKLMIFDVDGVLTDGRLWYGPQGEEWKAFHVLDGHGLKLLAGGGVATGLLSARSSPAVVRRAAELGLGHVLQGVADKRAASLLYRAKAGVKSLFDPKLRMLLEIYDKKVEPNLFQPTFVLDFPRGS